MFSRNCRCSRVRQETKLTNLYIPNFNNFAVWLYN